MAFAIYLRNKKLGAFFLVSAFLIFLASVFSGVHWPTDILAGAAIGIISAYAVNLFAQRFFSPR